MFIVLVASIVNASNHTKCVSLIVQKWEVQPTPINLHPNEYSQGFYYYPFVVKVLCYLQILKNKVYLNRSESLLIVD